MRGTLAYRMRTKAPSPQVAFRPTQERDGRRCQENRPPAASRITSGKGASLIAP